ncbi:MAG TPA: M6 family metalloprotease domain-containing protein, partial [Bacteroidales bacterium]|nr:M6 family metalloprotease domain-containing protein [Bacteroidales bacterium]
MAFLQNISKNFRFSDEQIKEMRQSVLPVNINRKGTTMGGFPTTGTRKMLMILANFSNTTTTIPQSSFNNYMNQANYNGTGSFKDYYLEVSYGQLTVNSTVTIWVTLPNTHNYYGPDSKWGEFAYDAVVAANNQANVNYAEYDNDGDGYVDGIAIIHQGPGQESTANTNDIWSHSWDLISAGYNTSQLTFDGVIVNSYTTQPELMGTSSSISTIGVMCHEFGHNLGAPDFYDTDYSTSGQYTGTGEWDIMAEGSWNGNSGDKPAHHNPWTKIYFQWSTPTLLTTAQNVTALNNQTNNQIFKYNTTTSNEYFLAVNQQKTGFNSGIPGHGLIIYHVDGNYITNHMDANDI